jgi:glutamine synthetase
MTTPKNVMKMIKDNDVKYVDFRFTDPRGKWQHVTSDVTTVDEDTFADGIMFDGSSIAGWKAIHESDMQLMPDPESACLDPFFAETTLVLVCDTLEPLTGEPYNRDPRSIAKKAAGLVKSMAVGDTIFFGPEAEFFIFDDVRFSATPYNTGYRVDSVEFPTNSDTEYEGGNLGHHIGFKKGYFPVPPLDTAQDMRSEMLAAMARMGVKVEKHHHEVGSAQHELGMQFAPMVRMADQMQIYKYCIQQVAQVYGKTATFMPNPIYGDNGSGMHCHQSIWKATSRCSPATNMPTSRTTACNTSPAFSSTPEPSTRSPIRRRTPTSGWCRASKPRCCSPTRCAIVPPAAAFRSRHRPRASAWRSAIRTRYAIRISASPRC